MTHSEQLLRYLSRRELAKNRKFKNLHKGQSCYLFGNGVSLKSMDLSKFAGKVSIGCSFLFVHKDFEQLDCRYYAMPATHFFYPYRRFDGNLQRNYLGGLYRRKIRQYQQTHFVTSLSNWLSMRGRNVSYVHHFGRRVCDVNACEMDGEFSFMAGALYTMLGIAIYMGFESALLVGCDYTFSPRQDFHFFEKGRGTIQDVINNDVYRVLFEEAQKRLELTTIVPSGMKSNDIAYVSYEDHVGSRLSYRENTELVDAESLSQIQRQGRYYDI